MNWDAIGAIGQMLGSVAVFVTLVYVAAQVRQARRETRRGLSQGRGEAFRHLMDVFEPFSDSFLKANAVLGGTPPAGVAALMQQASVTQEVAFRLMLIELLWWNFRIQVIPYIDELPPIERTFFDVGCRFSYGQPGVARVVYDAYIKPTQHPDAVRYIDNLLAQPG